MSYFIANFNKQNINNDYTKRKEKIDEDVRKNNKTRNIIKGLILTGGVAGAGLAVNKRKFITGSLNELSKQYPMKTPNKTKENVRLVAGGLLEGGNKAQKAALTTYGLYKLDEPRRNKRKFEKENNRG